MTFPQEQNRVKHRKEKFERQSGEWGGTEIQKKV